MNRVVGFITFSVVLKFVKMEAFLSFRIKEVQKSKPRSKISFKNVLLDWAALSESFQKSSLFIQVPWRESFFESFLPFV
jgi:hypothetical protein